MKRTLFIQVKCEMGRTYEVAEAVNQVEFVSEVYSISGQYDLMIQCYIQDDSIDIGRFVTEKIQKVKGIRETFTIIAFNAFPRLAVASGGHGC
jgi:DNA-binding Lrp family transcriptional regulator